MKDSKTAVRKQKEKFLRKKIGKAIRDYDMIQPGDRIFAAVSGGQDSMTILTVLASKTLRASLKYSLMAGHVVTDFVCGECTERTELLSRFDDLNVPFHVDTVKVAETSTTGQVNCFWCSWNKRKAIFESAERFGCNKIVFGHHKDDIIETVLLNLFYNGEIATMNPRQSMFKGKITLIRPLCYVEKKEITAFARAAGFRSSHCTCPFGDISKRKSVRAIIEGFAKHSRMVKTNIFRAPSRIRNEYLGIADSVD